MVRRLYREILIAECGVDLVEIGNPEGDPGYLPDPLPEPRPLVRAGRAGIDISTRCPDFGPVDLEVWAGEPAPRPDWAVVFDGELESKANGFDAGNGSSSLFHVNAPPGRYRVRAEAHRDPNGEVDGVRFIFADAEDLDGTALWGPASP